MKPIWSISLVLKNITVQSNKCLLIFKSKDMRPFRIPLIHRKVFSLFSMQRNQWTSRELNQNLLPKLLALWRQMLKLDKNQLRKQLNLKTSLRTSMMLLNSMLKFILGTLNKVHKLQNNTKHWNFFTLTLLTSLRMLIFMLNKLRIISTESWANYSWEINSKTRVNLLPRWICSSGNSKSRLFYQIFNIRLMSLNQSLRQSKS